MEGPTKKVKTTFADEVRQVREQVAEEERAREVAYKEFLKANPPPTVQETLDHFVATVKEGLLDFVRRVHCSGAKLWFQPDGSRVKLSVAGCCSKDINSCQLLVDWKGRFAFGMLDCFANRATSGVRKEVNKQAIEAVKSALTGVQVSEKKALDNQIIMKVKW